MSPPEVTPTSVDPRPHWLWLCRLSLLVALAASTALYVQYLNPMAASFCGLGSGCDAVRRLGFFGYSYFFGTPFLSIPLVGVISFASLFAVSLRDPDGPWTVRLAGAGAALAIALLVAQTFVVKAFCWLCTTADVAAILAFVFASADRRASGNAARDPLRGGAWAVLAVLAVALPPLWARVKPDLPVPDQIRALYVPGKINVVEFADFECPFCRMLHPVLKRVISEYPPGRVHFVRKHVPLPSHEEAAPAARAAVCAEAQGKGEELAEELMKGELSFDAIRVAAGRVGVELARWDLCLALSEADPRIQADMRLLETTGMFGLPTTYVQDVRLLGAVPEEDIRDAFARAARGGGGVHVPALVYAALCAILALVVAWLGRRDRVTLHHGRTR